MLDQKGKSLTHYLVTDLGGLVRGRGAWSAEKERKASVGWVPVNQLISPFDTIPSPNIYGSHGDCRLYADGETLTRITLPNGAPMCFMLCDVGSLDGADFGLCARSFLKRMLEALREEGLRVLASFEQEFWLTLPGSSGTTPGFSYQRMLRHEPFGTDLMSLLEAAGVEPEMLLPEFAPEQFELTLAPAFGVTAADRAVISREIVRAAAHGAGGHASFVPLRAPGGVGCGVHVHLSLWDLEGRPVLYDARGSAGLSAMGQHFCAGILAHMPALCALSAPSVVSYERLQPHRWSSAYTCLGDRNREAALRICPVVSHGGADPAPQFNLEYRAADATANPYLVLGGLIAAGLEGIRQRLPAPALVNTDPHDLAPEIQAAQGIRRLPASLTEALDALVEDSSAKQWLGGPLYDAYVTHKRHEAFVCAGLDAAAICDRYAAIF